MLRNVELSEVFEIKCKLCGSIYVKLNASHCDYCGNTIDTICNSCGASYKCSASYKIEN